MNTIVRIIMICLAGLWFSSTAMAKGADKAKKAFESGDYSKAYKLLNKAAKGAKGAEKAELLVMAGASAAKIGKGSAKSKFKKALKLDPNVSLPNSVASDKKVKKAFAAAQKASGVSTASDGGGKGSTDNIKSAKGGADTSAGNIANYLPFGINNFLQGKTVVGALMGAAQVGSIVFILNRKQAAAAADADAKGVIQTAEETNQTEDPEFLAFIDDNEAFVTKARSEANLGIFMFIGAYSLSVVDALFDPFGLNKRASIDRRSDRRVADAEAKDWKFNLNVLPRNSEASVLVDMKKNF